MAIKILVVLLGIAPACAGWVIQTPATNNYRVLSHRGQKASSYRAPGAAHHKPSVAQVQASGVRASALSTGAPFASDDESGLDYSQLRWIRDMDSFFPESTNHDESDAQDPSSMVPQMDGLTTLQFVMSSTLNSYESLAESSLSRRLPDAMLHVAPIIHNAFRDVLLQYWDSSRT